jgi:hypothetical protein
VPPAGVGTKQHTVLMATLPGVIVAIRTAFGPGFEGDAVATSAPPMLSPRSQVALPHGSGRMWVHPGAGATPRPVQQTATHQERDTRKREARADATTGGRIARCTRTQDKRRLL